MFTTITITSFVHSDEFAVILKKYFSQSTVFKALSLCNQSFIIKNKIKNQNARSIIQRNVMNFEDSGRGTKLLKVYITLHVKIFFFLFFF